MPELIKLRAGSYLEPTRFETSDMRVHATAGIDLKLFRGTCSERGRDNYVWRVGFER